VAGKDRRTGLGATHCASDVVGQEQAVLTNHVLRQPDGAPIALCAQAVSQMQEMRFAHCHLTTA
jgi:hypothetical protein